MLSAVAPPDAAATVVVVTSVTVSIAPELVNENAPFASAIFVTTYLRITMFPSLTDLLTTPSPK